MWKRMGSFLGLVEEYDDDYREDDDDEDVRSRPADREAPVVRAEPSNVRRIAPVRTEADRPSVRAEAERSAMRAGGGATAVALQEPPETVRVSAPRPAPPAPPPAPAAAKVHLTEPTTFNDVEEVGEHFRDGVAVIMNLQGAGENVAKRLLDFASGLIFGLDGRIERVGDRVFLLTPLGVEVSTEERRRLSERGFFNQA